MRTLNTVDQIYSHDIDMVNSDKELLVQVWLREGLVLSPYQKQVFMNCTPAESITRAARHLRQTKYASFVNEKIRQERYNKFKEYRQGEIW